MTIEKEIEKLELAKELRDHVKIMRNWFYSSLCECWEIGKGCDSDKNHMLVRWLCDIVELGTSLRGKMQDMLEKGVSYYELLELIVKFQGVTD